MGPSYNPGNSVCNCSASVGINMLPLRVGNDLAAIVDVMGVIEILSSRKEYTKLNLYFICYIVGCTFKSDHQITSSTSFG